MKPLASTAAALAAWWKSLRAGRWWLVAGLVAVPVALALNPASSRHDRQAMNTVTVERSNIEKTITAVGSLKAKDYVDVGTQVSGRVQKVHVAIGDRVAKGDLIAEIDPTVYESTVRKDRANLETLAAQLNQQKAELALARQQLTRNSRMLGEQAVSQDAVDQAQAAFRVAEASVASTRAATKAAQATLSGDLANLGYTRIYAPLAGTVVSQTTLEGQTVNAAQSAPTIVQVANLDVMTVWAQVAEADVPWIKVGMPAWFTTLGMPERRWRGIVRQLQPTPQITNDVVLYNVLVDVDNREGLLLPSMTVQVFFLQDEARGVPVIELSALQADHAAGSNVYHAKVLTDDGPEDRRVVVGLSNRNTAQVVSGLAPGDRVIVPKTEPPTDQASSRRPERMIGPRL